MAYKPVVIIGAPRSGTNMLRDVLTQVSGVGTWPCDEINYIWRHGNIGCPTDEFSPDMARPSVRNYITRHFDKLAKTEKLQVVIEKTCANSLRVEFVDKVLPEARYVYLVRDGLDTVASAKLRWTAKLDIPYLARKVRYVPLSDFPYYGTRYFINRVYKMFSRDSRLAYWGPAIDGITDILKKLSLEEVCALQWQRCVERSDKAFEIIDPSRICRVSYEKFVANPVEELTRICGFIGVDLDVSKARELVRGVSAKSVGKGRQKLSQDKVEVVEKLIGSTLEKHGYINRDA